MSETKIEVKLVEGQVLRLQPGDVLWIEFDKKPDVDVLPDLERMLPAGVKVIAAHGARPVAPPKEVERDFGDFSPGSLGAGPDEPGVG